MATDDFQVRNGLLANTYVIVGNSVVNATINSTSFTGTANNANNLGGFPASSYVRTSGAYELSGNITFTGNTTFSNNVTFSPGANVYANGSVGTAGQVLESNGSSVYWATPLYINTASAYTWTNTQTFNANVVVSANLAVGSNVIVNTSAVFVGNASQNAYLTATGLSINGVAFSSGGGYYKGNQGVVGAVSNANNLFRINANTMSNNITIDAQDNALTVGPITIGSAYTLTISPGGRVVII